MGNDDSLYKPIWDGPNIHKGLGLKIDTLWQGHDMYEVQNIPWMKHKW
jgi:hypothetical protein